MSWRMRVRERRGTGGVGSPVSGSSPSAFPACPTLEPGPGFPAPSRRKVNKAWLWPGRWRGTPWQGPARVRWSGGSESASRDRCHNGVSPAWLPPSPATFTSDRQLPAGLENWPKLPPEARVSGLRNSRAHLLVHLA